MFNGPLNVEELLYALSGYKNRQLVLFVESLVQRKMIDEAGKKVPFETEHVGRMGLRVKKLLPLELNDDLRQVLAGEMTVIRLSAEIEDLELVGLSSAESEDVSPVLRKGLQVGIWYNYISGCGLVWTIGEREEDEGSDSREEWLYLCTEAFLSEKEMSTGRKRKPLEEYQARLRELRLPEALIFDRVLMEMLRVGPY